MLGVFLNLDWLRATLNPPAPQASSEASPVPSRHPQPVDLPAATPSPTQPTPNQTPAPAPQMPPEEIVRPSKPPHGTEPQPVLPQDPTPEPGPVIDEPKAEPESPKPPEGTEVRPETPRVTIAHLAAGGPKIRVRYGQGEWADAAPKLPLSSGASLSVARGQADLWLSGGTLLRFDGEIQLSRVGNLTTIGIESRSIYADNIGLGEPLAFSVGDLSGAMQSGVAIASRDQSALELACVHGAATLCGESIAPGQQRRATARTVGAAKKFAGSRLTRDLPPRVVYREDFDTAPEGGLYGDGEKLDNGLLVRRGGGNYAAFRYNPTVTVQPGMVLRFRARTRAVTQLQLEVFLDKPHDTTCFNMRFRPAKDGEWQVFEIRLADFPDKQNPDAKMQPGQALRNFKLHIEGSDEALLEVDWVEYVRIQEG
ncbi:MAG: hypothetical protein KF754_15520 [Planctomycetes bacterium]|nr:hypothetical protein [Planctomycetota bacterium]